MAEAPRTAFWDSQALHTGDVMQYKDTVELWVKVGQHTKRLVGFIIRNNEQVFE